MKNQYCSSCKDTGVIEYIPMDGMTIYSWQKYEKKPCNCVSTNPNLKPLNENNNETNRRTN